jgi:hypothetical protein
LPLALHAGSAPCPAKAAVPALLEAVAVEVMTRGAVTLLEKPFKREDLFQSASSSFSFTLSGRSTV